MSVTETSRAPLRAAPYSYPLIGNLFDILRSPRGCVYHSFELLADQYGDGYTLKLAGREWHILSKWQDIQDLLLRQRQSFGKGSTLKEMTHMAHGQQAITDSDGEAWSRLRALLTPLFDDKYLVGFLPQIHKRCFEFALYLKQQQNFNALTISNRFAFALVCEYFFGHTVTSLEMDVEDRVLKNQRILTRELLKRIQIGPIWKYLPTIGNVQARRAVKENFAFFEAAIAKRMGDTRHRDALAGMISEGFPASAIATQLYGLVGAGFESTGSVIHWILYEAARHPQHAAAVREEVKSWAHDSNWDNTTILESPRLHNFVREVMRLYPPFPMLIRETLHDCQIGGRQFAKGSYVVGMLGRAMRAPGIWGQGTNDFNPDRMQTLSPEMVSTLKPYGVGKRLCLGEKLADLEIKAVTAFLLTQFKFEVDAKQKVYPKLKFALNSNNGIDMSCKTL